MLDIDQIKNTNNISCLFKIAKIQDNNFINDNTLIMSSFFELKNKFFSCFNKDESDSFNLYANKKGNFKFSNGDLSTSSNNIFQKFDFNCSNKENIIFFVVLKDECGQNSDTSNIFCGSIGGLADRYFYTFIQEVENSELNFINMNDFSEPKFEAIENILFFQPLKGITNFLFEENKDNNYNIFNTNLPSIKQSSYINNEQSENTIHILVTSLKK